MIFLQFLLNVFLSEKVFVTYHHKHFESLNEVVKMNAQHHEPDLDCADIVIHILDMMVDKYFESFIQLRIKHITLKMHM